MRLIILISTILTIVTFNQIRCERKSDKFKMNLERNDDSGTDMVRAFKAGYFGAKESSDKEAYAAAAARCAGEPTIKRTLRDWDKEDAGPYKDSGIKCHGLVKQFGIDAKQAFLAGASTFATDSLIKGKNKIKLKETV